MKTKLIQKIKSKKELNKAFKRVANGKSEIIIKFVRDEESSIQKIKEELDKIFEMMPSEDAFLEEESERGGYEKIEARDAVEEVIEKAISQSKEEMVVDENTSDGYHTFKELYEFRKVYNAVLFNEWARQGKYNVHKSWRHNDFELCFGGGWFIVMAELPTGQISNHYEAKDWDLFQCEERDIADKWDGHTAQDVVKRLLLLEDLNKK